MKILCADIGGTSSKFRVYHDDEIIGSYEDKPFNCSGKSKEDISNFIHSQLVHDCDVHVFGFAGIEESDANDLTDKKKGLVVTHDLELARFDAFNKSDGLVLILGTGMILSGKINGKQIKHAGNGFLFDKASGGFRLGQLLLQETLIEISRDEETDFLKKVLEKKQFFKEEFVSYCRLSYLSENVVKEIASNSVILLDLFSDGNKTAKRLVKNFLEELDDHLKINENKPIDLAFHGSLIKNKAFKKELTLLIKKHKMYNITDIMIDPLRAAYKIAKEFMK